MNLSRRNFSSSDRRRCRSAGRIIHRTGACFSIEAGARIDRFAAGSGIDIIARIMGENQWQA